MNKSYWIQGFLLKLGFILTICIPQSQSFGFSSLDYNQFLFRNSIELVGLQQSNLPTNSLNYFSYKQSFFVTSELSLNILPIKFHYPEFIRLCNEDIRVRVDINQKKFLNEIFPILSKNKSTQLFHLLRSEMLTYSA